MTASGLVGQGAQVLSGITQTTGCTIESAVCAAATPSVAEL